MQAKTQFGLPLPEGVVARELNATPFRILVMGDFGSDRAWSEPLRVDRDKLEDVFRRLGVRIKLPGDGEFPMLEFALNSMEEFHPDSLYEKLELFVALRSQRERLENDSTFAAEAEAIMAVRGDQTNARDPEPESTSAEVVSPDDASDLLNMMLDETEAAQKPVVQQIVEGSFSFDDFVRRTVAPHVEDQADPRQADLIAGVDSAITAAMRTLLHHPEFQRIEASWLGIKMLVRRLETSSKLQIGLINVSKQQLADDLVGSDDLTRSRLFRTLFDAANSEEDDPWTVVVGNYIFDSSQLDAGLLGRIARIHAATNAVFIAGGSADIVGCTDLSVSADPHDWTGSSGATSEHWQELRSLPSAASIALTIPGIMARVPYGKASDPIESFDFEETPDGCNHRDYLWMNAAFGVATVLGRSFAESGWSIASGWNQDLDDLPIFFFTENGESKIKPCAEVELVLRAGGVLSDAGLTPVYSIRDQGSVRIPSLRSLSLDSKTVAGTWK